MYIKSAFSISLATYVLLILAESFQPGFVSNYFSAHWLLLIALVLFIFLLRTDTSWKTFPTLEWLMTFVLAMVFAVVTWKIGRPLEELRILITLIVFALPFALLSTVKKS
ncbi:MAG: hypothetical protein O2877_02985 [bacterium]|nr:hypothetical protein [bacterium]